MDRTLDDVAETLRRAKENGRKCALLIGAGCSAKANIPTAGGFVDLINQQYPQAFSRANPKDYANCMSELAVTERRDLISHFVDRAKINWAHVCIAQLMKEGFVDRILTTNFDMLIVQSCALLGLFPAIYDLASSQLFQPADIPEKAVFYLHGQRTGFVLLNTEGEVQTHSELLAPVFTDAGNGRVWLVAGYSGDNDPVFSHLARVPRFDNNLYWMGFRDEQPSKHLREKLLVKGKYAFFVPGYDADDFFVRLAQELGVFPPEFVSRPFTHLKNLMERLSLYTIPGRAADVDVTLETREWISAAIDRHEDCPAKTIGSSSNAVNVVAVQQLLMSGDYEKIISLYETHHAVWPADANETVCWALLMRGSSRVERAKATVGSEADELFEAAMLDYDSTLSIDSRRYEALNHWGVALSVQASGKPPKMAYRLFANAVEKHRAALYINPKDAWTLNNLGNALAAQGGVAEGEESGKLFEEAVSQFRIALNIAPGKHEVLNSWGNALFGRARKEPERRNEFLSEAVEKFQAALQINRNDHWAMNSLANVLLQQALAKDGAENKELFEKALKTYQDAADIDSERHWSLHNWGNALVARSQAENGKESDRWFELAETTYESALAARPDYHWALNSWGYALYERGLKRHGAEAEESFARAGRKFYEALNIKADDHWSLQNWGRVLALEATFKEPNQRARLFDLAIEKFEHALILNPQDPWTLVHWGDALLSRAQQSSEPNRDQLVREARRKFQKAEELSPGCCSSKLERL